jgi:hypothetical protein
MKIEKAITKEIKNQADKNAVRIEINDIKEEDNAVFTTLYDADDKVLARNRVFTLAEFPCEPLNLGEKELFKDKDPNDKWDIKEIKLWLDSKQVEGDPPVYPKDAIKTDLLKIVTPVEKIEIAK